MQRVSSRSSYLLIHRMTTRSRSNVDADEENDAPSDDATDESSDCGSDSVVDF